jgi:beta-N-acetylhexosaminidase
MMNSARLSVPGLDEKIGQMIMVGFDGVDPSDPGSQTIIAQAKQGLIGGVIFFTRNIKSPQQICTLTHTLRTLPLQYPLFLAIDQEGGNVQRLNSTNGFKNYLSAYEVAHQLTPQEAEDYYRQMAAQTAAAGLNVVFGPIVDLHADPRSGRVGPVIGGLKRSFGDEPLVVTTYAQAFIQAHHQHHLLTALKHFPGHGYAAQDSHQGMVDITHTYAAHEREPFKNLIQAGLADMIMTAHLMHRHLDECYPVTLSSVILKKLLREELQYHGVIISDDLHMGAITQYYTVEEVVLRAIQAECDILLFSNNDAAAPNDPHVHFFSQPLAQQIHHIVKKAISQNQLTESRINDSYQRIVALKERISDAHLKERISDSQM